MKKIITILLLVFMIFVLVGCDADVKTYSAYANYTDVFSGYEKVEQCINIDKLYLSDAIHCPLLKFDTKAEFDKFKENYKDVFSMDKRYDEIQSFNELTAHCDDRFFANHSLMIAYVISSSSSIRYGASSVTNENGSFMMKISKLNNPEAFLTDMSGWFAVAEVSKDYIKDCKEFDAQLVEQK